MIKTIIVIVNDWAYVNGGSSKIAIDSAIALSENKNIRVIFFSSVSPIDDKLQKSNVEVICLNQHDILSNPNRKQAIIQGIWNKEAAVEFEKLLKSLDVEMTVIHFHGWTKALSSSLFKVVEKYKFKSLITVHEYFTVCPNGGLYNYKSQCICKYKPLSIRCLLSNCDKRSYIQKQFRVIRQIIQNYYIRKSKSLYIYISEFSKNIIKPYLKSPGYDLTNYVEMKKVDKIQVEKNCTYLYIGRVSKEKGVDLFCKAVNDLGVQGVVIGDGEQLQELQSQYANIQFTGWMKFEDMEQYIKKCRVFVFPSRWYETMGLTILEMQSYGIPCIVPDNCSASEYVTHFNNGLIFATGSCESLEENIKLTLDDELVKLFGDSTFKNLNHKQYEMSTHIHNLGHIYYDFLLYDNKNSYSKV